MNGRKMNYPSGSLIALQYLVPITKHRKVGIFGATSDSDDEKYIVCTVYFTVENYSKMYENVFFFQQFSNNFFLPLELRSLVKDSQERSFGTVQWHYRLCSRQVHKAHFLLGSILDDDTALNRCFLLQSIRRQHQVLCLSFLLFLSSPLYLSLRVILCFLCGYSFANRC